MTIERSLEGLPVEELAKLNGYEVHTSDGHRLGYVDLILADDATAVPEWLGVWDGLPGGPRRIVPIRGARHVGAEIHVPWTKDVVEPAPSYHEGFLHDKPQDVRITREQEEEAYTLYGVEPVTAAPEGVYVYRFRAVVIR
jgi:hypothetical protein